MTQRKGVGRRTLLRGAGMAMTATMFPRGMGVAKAAWQEGGSALQPGQTRADYPVSEVTRQLSAYMSEARDRALPEAAIEHAKRHILDTFAAMVSGAELPAGRAALAFARAYGGKPVATVVADSQLVGPIEAALANGTMAHADETDDTLAPGPWHPGSCVVPAGLALGEQFRISGAQFVRAVVLGYDVGTRILAAAQNGPTATHRSSYSLGGVFGAAAAGASAAGFTAEQMRLVLAYSAESSAGIEVFPRDPDHIQKGFMFSGLPAQGGTTAVLLVKAGWTGVSDILSGPDNFLEDLTPSPKRELLTEQLGDRYDVTRANIKRWTVGQPIQAPLDALEALLKRQPIDPAQVQEIALRYQPGSITDNSGPSDINVQHALAVMLVDKTATFQALHDRARMQDPATVRLRTRVRIVQGQGRGGGGVPLLQVVLADGTRLTQDTVAPGPLGTLANPMNREQVVAKARELMAPVLGASQTSKLIDRVIELENVKDIRDLRPLLQAPARNGPPRLSAYPSSNPKREP